MKTTVLCFFIGLLFFVSCKPTEPDDSNKPPVVVVVDTLGVSISSISFKSSQDASLLVVRTKDNWTATENVDWISLSATSGKGDTGFIIGATQNTSTLRETDLTITAGNQTKTIKITQSGGATP